MPETPAQRIKMSELMSALSMAADVAEGHEIEHGVKTSYISLRIAEVMKLSVQERSDVFYTTFLKHAT